MARRKHRNRRPTQDMVVTKAAAVTPAATFTPQQVAALLQAAPNPAGQQVTGALRPLPRTEPPVAFGPGVPLIPGAIDPLDPRTMRPMPRRNEYPVSVNLPGMIDRLVPWSVLRDAADRIGLVRRCIEIRKNEVATLDWGIVISKSAVETAQQENQKMSRAEVENDLRERLLPHMARCTQFWQSPDPGQDLNFPEWVSSVLEDHLVLDAVALYPRKTRGGKLYALEHIDGSTIKLLRDNRGGRPMPPQPAFQQILHGFPRGEYTADTDNSGNIPNGYPADRLIYKRRNVRSHTVYGFSAVEQALEDADLYMKRHQWMRAEYTDGTMPAGWLTMAPEFAGWTPQQVREYERNINDTYSGQTEERHRIRLLPPGIEPKTQADVAERYKPEYDLFLLELMASHFDTTIAELGFSRPQGLGSSGWHEGMEDVQDRKGTQPTLKWLQAFLTDVSHRWLDMPAELEFQFFGLEAEDEAAADEVADRRIKSGRITLNEDRDRLGLPRYEFDEADMPMMYTTRGVVFIEDSSKLAPGGVTIQPMESMNVPTPEDTGENINPDDEDENQGQDQGQDDNSTNKPNNDDDESGNAAAKQPTNKKVTKADGGGAGPKVVTARHWPGWERDIETANHWAPQLTQAVRGAIDTRTIAREWLALRGAAKADSHAVVDARHWLDSHTRNHTRDLALALLAVLRKLWTDGWLIGALSARAITRTTVAGAVPGVYWHDWKPGDTDAATRIVNETDPDHGARHLEEFLIAAAAVANGIAGTRANRIARVLADARDDETATEDSVTAALDHEVNGDWSGRVALTEVGRAGMGAAMAWYADAQVEATEWATAGDQRVCPACEDNEAAGPVPLGSAFPSGDTAPPGHPGCRCSAVPSSMPVSDFLGLGDKTDSKHHEDTEDHHGQYTAADIGVPSLTLLTVDPRELHVDARYQRKANLRRVERYMTEPVVKLRSRVGLIAVRRDGTMWIVNGQHHTAAAIAVGIDHMTYDAFPSSGWRDEARVYKAWETWHEHSAHHEGA